MINFNSIKNKILNLFFQFISLSIDYWIIFIEQYWWLIGLISGFSFICSFLTKDAILSFGFLLIFLVGVLVQPTPYFLLAEFTQYSLPVKHLYAFIGGFIFSSITINPASK